MTFWRSDAPELIDNSYKLREKNLLQLRAIIKSCKSLEGESCMLMGHISSNTDKRKPARPAPDRTQEKRKNCMLLEVKL